MFTEIGVYLAKIGLSMLLGIFLGYEREEQKKPAGLRDITLVCLGATSIVLFTMKFIEISKLTAVSFDLIRAISYYLVALGFLGSGIMKASGKKSSITTGALLLPVAIVGFYCGIGEYFQAITLAFVIYFVLKLKHLIIKTTKVKRKFYVKRKRHNRII